MARPLDFDAFCERTRAKGRAHAVIAALHPGTEIAARLQLDGAERPVGRAGATRKPTLRRRVADARGPRA